jgi:hypothetical protein
LPHAEFETVIKVFEFLESAYKERVILPMFLRNRPAFDNIRSDPRFADLVRRIGLPIESQ